jgi:tyrosyl-tRNA synthetase
MKMSKSKPDSAIFMTDSREEVKRKISKAYCPVKTAKNNPVLEYCKYMIFERFAAMEIKRPEKFGGDMNIENYEKLEKLYTAGKLHPADLKNTVADAINELLEPARKHFSTNAKARNLAEQVKSFEITR